VGRRFTYSRWDGTQRVLGPDSDDLLAEITDEVIHHGDVAAALRRIMHNGLDRGDGRDVEGLRSMIERLRQRRAELAKGDPGGMFTRLNEQLDDILDEERLAIDRLRPTDGDRADSRALQLDLLPDALAARIEELRTYDFVSDEAKRRFDALLDDVREQIMQRHVDQISGAMQQLDDAQLAEVKDMLAALNDMLARHGRGEDPQFEAFMERFGAHFPENPASLDELLELLARRMAAARSVLNAMSPEQREQLRELSEQLLGDMDLRWQMDQLADNLQSMYPDLGWNDAAEFSGGDPLSMRDALRAAEEMGRLQDLEAFLSRAAAPGQLADVDLDAVARHLGDDSADSLRRLAGLADSLAEAGLIDTTEGRLELTARGLRQGSPTRRARHGSRACRGHEAVRVRGPVPSRFAHDTAQFAAQGRSRRSDRTPPRRLRSRAHRTPDALLDRAHGRPVAVDADARQLPAGKEGGGRPARAHLLAFSP